MWVEVYRNRCESPRSLRVDPKNFKLPVIFLNLRGYDSHFIMQEIGKISKENKLNINYIPNNTEKYIAFMLGKNSCPAAWKIIQETYHRMDLNIPARYSKLKNLASSRRKEYILMTIWIVFRDLVTSKCPQKAQYEHA